MTFSRHADGSVTVDEFPDEVTMSQLLMDGAERSRISMEQDRIRIRVANGEATYIISDRDPVLKTLDLTRLYSKMWKV
jgi:hypothetical protein